ncbi:hypothetical protein EIN_486520 [Entamoeba invadens IP1]|uniref:Uncharacterized protein n=1 Tax=Entamoeba invadens IP1 TaxID=370355 RepID=A0A0A1U824_ENTIV|nr:hypothetical protein EIN_486520 [Entamoeba invadens IP1]ELP89210.1 hypothetical protein EIN_486520 [Entamoeba invadens IP1]|eukprot:XP_004255981.1 hypothetical protein EIN_486520 [Entamoeba invadens IP1]
MDISDTTTNFESYEPLLVNWLRYELRGIRQDEPDFSTFRDGLLLRQLYEKVNDLAQTKTFPASSFVEAVYENSIVISTIFNSSNPTLDNQFTLGETQSVISVLVKLFLNTQKANTVISFINSTIESLEPVLGRHINNLSSEWSDGSLFTQLFLILFPSISPSFFNNIERPVDAIDLCIDQAYLLVKIPKLITAQGVVFLHEEFSLAMYFSYFKSFIKSAPKKRIMRYDEITQSKMVKLIQNDDENYKIAPVLTKPKTETVEKVETIIQTTAEIIPEGETQKEFNINIYQDNPHLEKDKEDLEKLKQLSNWYEGINLDLLYESPMLLFTPDKNNLAAEKIRLFGNSKFQKNNKKFMKQYYERGCCLLRGLLVPMSEKSAFENFEMAAKFGHIASIHNLGLMKERGMGCPQDKRGAREMYKVALNSGCLYSCNNLAVLQYISGDVNSAQTNWRFSAGKGLLCSLNNLGVSLITSEPDRAVKMLVESARYGNMYSIFNLGVLAFKGLPGLIPVNIKTSIDLFTRSFGVVQSRYNLGVLSQMGVGVPKDEKKALRYYSQSLCSETSSEVNIAISFLYGDYNKEREEDMTVKILKSHNTGVCKFHLGMCYRKGCGVLESATKSAECYKESMGAGNEFAKFHVACVKMIHHDDKKESLELVKEAVEAGYWVAKSWYGRYLYQENKEEGLSLIREACRMQDKRALYALSIHLYKEENKLNESIQILNTLVASNFKEAIVTLGVFYLKGVGVQKDVSQACSLWRKAKSLGDKTAESFIKACE